MKPSRSNRLAGAMRRTVWTVAIVAGLLAICAVPPVGTAAAASPEQRVNVAELTPEVEAAIDNALKSLPAMQNKDGSWGRQYKVASTSLTLMAYMLKGHFPKKGPYGGMLDRGLEYLLNRSNAGVGYMGINMYEHALATLALSEAWGMSDRDEVHDALKKGVELIIKSQGKSGGWRYDPRPTDADVSVTAMQLVALASAREAGILVPGEVFKRAVAYVKTLQVANGGFGYTSASDPIFSRSAAGLMALEISGERDTPAVQRGLDYLKKLPDSKFTNVSGFYMYGHYYAIQATYQAGEEHYQDWYPRIREVLLAHQQRDGSWRSPEASSDAAYATSMGVLILGVPYRYLPIYQR